ncbi:H(+)/Cl(-) exchange transporter 7 [Trachymyrmex zeteki]|uniref:Chloride channel protein n=1 Tax=Mycetomoellerius zeteki TaxID=64791 RepID=A0A151XF47_9HYME|nr:H(+)/Cl(-) exchange transporter 7 [Trachymyrmex zeteki]
MNSSMQSNVNNDRGDSDSIDVYDEDDGERLIKPRNNFASYSNEDINVRFRSIANINVTCSNIEAISGQSRRLHIRDITPGATNFLSTNYESLDYDPCENYLLQDEERKKGYKFIVRKNFARWFIFLLIGICTALIACFVDILIEELSSLKYGWLKKYVDQCVMEGCLWLPYMTWLVLNIVPVFIGAVLVSYIEPVAAGSGIPQVKCYLNGVKIPRVVRIKTLAVKTIGVICTVVGGLAGGKEGPMIHSGAVIAAGISQGKSTTFKKDLKIFEYFREDHEKREFVSGGAASGVSAAFGAPIGGVLFSIEEGTSFFNQSLTWRTFFASMITTFTLNVILSAYHGHPGDLSYPGLLNLGKFNSIPYKIYEIPLFMLMGTFGGLLGAFWNHVNYKITCFRLRFVTRKWQKVVEALLVAILSATMGSLMIYFVNDCKPLGNDPTKFPVQMYCAEGQYNAVASLWFQTPESSVRSLFHDPKGAHNDLTLAIFVVLYFFLAAATFGLSMSSGLFIPSLLIGSAWGRLIGSALAKLCPHCEVLDPGKYALLGAAAQLGGVVRMTISLTAILIEATQGIYFGLPVIIVLIMAKWIGDFFNEARAEINSYGRLRGLILRSQLIVLLKDKVFNEYEEFWEKPLSINMFRNEYPRYPTIEQVAITDEEKTYTIDLRHFMNPSPYTVQHSATLPRTFRLFRALGLRHVPVVNDINEVIGIITRKDVARFRIWRHRGKMGLDELLITNQI